MPAGFLRHTGHDLCTGHLARGLQNGWQWTEVIGKGKIFMCEAVQSKVKLLYPGIKQSEAAHLSVSALD